MKAIVCGVVLGATCLMGCDTFSPKDHYQVMIDPAFSPSYQQDIVEAAGMWQTALGPKIDITVYVGKCTDTDHQVCVVPNDATPNQVSDGNWQIGFTHPTLGGGAWIQLWINSYPMVVQEGAATSLDQAMRHNAAHELGHAFCGPYHLGPGHLMYYLYDKDQTDYLTPGDIAHFWSVR